MLGVASPVQAGSAAARQARPVPTTKSCHPTEESIPAPPAAYNGRNRRETKPDFKNLVKILNLGKKMKFPSRSRVIVTQMLGVVLGLLGLEVTAAFFPNAVPNGFSLVKPFESPSWISISTNREIGRCCLPFRRCGDRTARVKSGVLGGLSLLNNRNAVETESKTLQTLLGGIKAVGVGKKGSKPIPEELVPELIEIVRYILAFLKSRSFDVFLHDFFSLSEDVLAIFSDFLFCVFGKQFPTIYRLKEFDEWQ
jgi:hypothetical protein